MVELEEAICATSAPPLDYSFQELKSLKDLSTREPTVAFHSHKLQRKKDDSEEQPSEEHHYIKIREFVTSIRLAYNSLSSLEGLRDEISAIVDDTSLISWLDLSHNQIESIGNALSCFPNLKALYLHGNRFNRLKPLLEQVSRSCPRLRKLTLFGSAIEERKFYRWNVIRAFPNLQSLDFIRITKRDRVLADIWCQIHKRQKPKAVNPTD